MSDLFDEALLAEEPAQQAPPRVARRDRAERLLAERATSREEFEQLQADGLAVIPPFTAVTRGDMLRYIPFSECVR